MNIKVGNFFRNNPKFSDKQMQDALPNVIKVLKVEIISVENNIVTDSIMTLRASNHVLCNLWSYDFV